VTEATSEATSGATSPHPDVLYERRAADVRMPFNGGRLVGRALQKLGVGTVFTISGGHLFPVFDGLVENRIRVVDHRHEESAGHAAEAWAKLTRQPGVCAVTAGPGVTNVITSVAAAQFNRSPMVVLGGRAPDFRWGQGSLQEYDHLPLMRSLTKSAVTVHEPDRLHLAVYEAWHEAQQGAFGPTYLDAGLDILLSTVEEDAVEWPQAQPRHATVDPDAVKQVVSVIDAAERPVIIAGAGVYWHHGEGGLRELAERAQIPVYANGLGRGLLPADHPCAFSRTRSAALGGADLVILLGTPLDFRLNFGDQPLFPAQYHLVRIDALPEDLVHNRRADAGIAGHVGAALAAVAELVNGAANRLERDAWVTQLREREQRSAERDRELLEADADPIHPARVYGEILKRLDRDAVVIGDGGDFVSWAGKLVPSYEPGRFIDPGPFGGLGMGPASAIAARLAHPDKQVVLLLGDGAFGFAGMEFDTMVRHRLPVVAVMGNNHAWGLEKHPMEMMYGWSVAADLNPQARYDKVVEALGGHGEFVERPADIGPALDRAFASGLPALVNVACDPHTSYPRSANLA